MRNVHCLLIFLISLASFAQVEVGKTYRIVPVEAPTSSLFIKDASPSAGTAVVVWPETDVPAQQWTVGRAGSLYYTFRSPCSGQFLGLKATTRGSTVQTSASGASSRWQLQLVDSVALIYDLRPASSSFVLALTSSEGGSSPQLAVAADTPKGQWQFIEVPSPQTTFTSVVRNQMLNDYLARFLQTKGSSYRTFNDGGWSESEQFEVLLDAYETTGNVSYIRWATYLFNWFKNNVGNDWTGGSKSGYNWYGYDFNDDVMWQIIGVARFALLTADSRSLTLARQNFDRIYQRAYMPEFGMMRWAEQTGERTSTNSCIHGPTEVAACLLAKGGAGEKYYEIARDLYAKQRQYLFDSSTGQVYDNYVFATGNRNSWASTYNQGTMLGAALLLYEHYGNTQYKSDAEKIARYASTRLCDDNGIINVCQVNDGDLCGFKGILMRYMRRFVVDLGKASYNEWMSKNAFRAYNNRATNGVTSSAWLTKSTEDVATNAFSCSTAASAAANVVLHPVHRNAADTIQAEAFDGLCGLYVTNGSSSQVLSNIRNGYWAVYANIDFGQEPVQSIAVRLTGIPTATDTPPMLQVYLDSISDTPVANIPLSSEEETSDAWQTVAAALQPTVGQHAVYLRFQSPSVTASSAIQVDWFTFSPQPYDALGITHQPPPSFLLPHPPSLTT